jgi:hypothetical protein
VFTGFRKVIGKATLGASRDEADAEGERDNGKTGGSVFELAKPILIDSRRQLPNIFGS